MNQKLNQKQIDMTKISPPGKIPLLALLALLAAVTFAVQSEGAITLPIAQEHQSATQQDDDYDLEQDAWSKLSEQELEEWVDWWEQQTPQQRARANFKTGFDRRGLDDRLTERGMYDGLAIRLSQATPEARAKFWVRMEEQSADHRAKLKNAVARLERRVAEQRKAAADSSEGSKTGAVEADRSDPPATVPPGFPGAESVPPVSESEAGETASTLNLQPGPVQWVVQAEPEVSLKVNEWQMVEPYLINVEGRPYIYWQVTGLTPGGPTIQGRPLEPGEEPKPRWAKVSDTEPDRVIWSNAPEGYTSEGDLQRLIEWYRAGGSGTYRYDKDGNQVSEKVIVDTRATSWQGLSFAIPEDFKEWSEFRSVCSCPERCGKETGTIFFRGSNWNDDPRGTLIAMNWHPQKTGRAIQETMTTDYLPQVQIPLGQSVPLTPGPALPVEAGPNSFSYRFTHSVPNDETGDEVRFHGVVVLIEHQLIGHDQEWAKGYMKVVFMHIDQDPTEADLLTESILRTMRYDR